jgi:hypothetical protein
MCIFEKLDSGKAGEGARHVSHAIAEVPAASK